MVLIKQSIPEWADQKHWWWYLPVVAFMGYLQYQHMADPLYQNVVMYGINLLIHEAGHFIFAIFGQFMGILGGSLLEVLFPFLFVVSFLRQGEYFGVAFSLSWLATALFSVGAYAADGKEKSLPLIADGLTHDWGWLLRRLNIVEYDNVVGGVFMWLGVVAGCGGILFGCGLLIYMIMQARLQKRALHQEINQ